MRYYDNTYIRSLYSPGYSSLLLSLYKTNLTLGFTPWVGRLNQYEQKGFRSTSIDYEKAAALCLLAKPILEGNHNYPVYYAIPCNNDATLILELKQDRDGQMRSYLTLEKKREQITFQFSTQTYKVNENGKMVEKVIQAGLGVFILTLEAYLTGIDIGGHLSKQSANESGNTHSQAPVW